jgi:hypothetical protein
VDPRTFLNVQMKRKILAIRDSNPGSSRECSSSSSSSSNDGSVGGNAVKSHAKDIHTLIA